MRIDLRDVVSSNCVPLFNETATSADSICPYCGKKKLHFNFKDNVFNCPACGEARGGILDAWALYRNISSDSKHILYRNVKIDIEEFYDLAANNSAKMVSQQKRRITYIKKEEKLAPVSVRNETYSALFESLQLNNRHRKNLRDRGFTDEEINYFGFKSLPTGNFPEVAKNLIDKGCTLKGVPGFYINYQKNYSFVRYGAGILIPEKNAKGQIMQCQARMDEGDVRYLTLSSGNKDSGTRGRAVCHFAGDYSNDNKLKHIILTEGPIKANFTYAKLKIPTISVPGVSSTKHLKAIIPELKDAGLEKISIAYDMDSYSNEYVKKALDKIKSFLYKSDVDFETLTWNYNYKGIDDYLKFAMTNRNI